MSAAFSRVLSRARSYASARPAPNGCEHPRRMRREAAKLDPGLARAGDAGALVDPHAHAEAGALALVS